LGVPCARAELYAWTASTGPLIAGDSDAVRRAAEFVEARRGGGRNAESDEGAFRIKRV
jgi:hypothetical protein